MRAHKIIPAAHVSEQSNSCAQHCFGAFAFAFAFAFLPTKRDGQSLIVRFVLPIGPKQAMVRMIPCGCDACIEQLKKPWDPKISDPAEQERYKQNRSCKLWPIFEGINDWRLATVQETSATDPEDLEDLYAEVLSDAAAQMEEAVEVGNYGAQGVDGDEYYLVRFDSTPYTLQEDTTSHNQHIAAGERVCDCTYLYECHRARGYYRNALEGDQDTSVLVKMAHVVDGDVKMTPMLLMEM